MDAKFLTTSKSISSVPTFRRWLLRIHGTILMLVALGSALATTIGWMTGVGPFGFMRQNALVCWPDPGLSGIAVGRSLKLQAKRLTQLERLLRDRSPVNCPGHG
jgi:hypothetical protein